MRKVTVLRMRKRYAQTILTFRITYVEKEREKYVTETKKKEIYLHQLFSKLHNYFSSKSPHTSIHFRQNCTSFLNPSFKKWCFVLKPFPPYPSSYCTHINTLITTNHFLTAHFTLPIVLLYPHQHTDHHKPFPHCTLHLTHRLTVLTSTH